jgi:hypothetical protein
MHRPKSGEVRAKAFDRPRKQKQMALSRETQVAEHEHRISEPQCREDHSTRGHLKAATYL